MALKNKLQISSKLAAAILLLAALAACGGNEAPTGGGKSGLQDASSEVADIYKTKAKCISCHGNDLQGKVGPNTNLQHVGARLSYEEIVARIEDGEGVMPAFKDKLTPDEINSLAMWLAGKK